MFAIQYCVWSLFFVFLWRTIIYNHYVFTKTLYSGDMHPPIHLRHLPLARRRGHYMLRTLRKVSASSVARAHCTMRVKADASPSVRANASSNSRFGAAAN